jgi:hypothetical protein
MGTLGGYYSYKYGGLDGIHTVGMSVTPHVTLHFEKPVNLNGLLENYIDLYMMMRFLIGKQLDFTSVKIHLEKRSNNRDINLYLPEKTMLEVICIMECRFHTHQATTIILKEIFLFHI